MKALVKKLSNDVACGEDFSPDFTSEHVVKTSNGDVGHEEHDDDDVVSVVDGGESSSENPREEVPGPVVPPSTLPSPSRENPGKVDDPSLVSASALPSPIGTTLPSPSRENAGSSAEGTPLTARKLFATPDSAMKVREAPKSYSYHNLIVE